MYLTVGQVQFSGVYSKGFCLLVWPDCLGSLVLGINW
jgi:hypothetical protein